MQIIKQHKQECFGSGTDHLDKNLSANNLRSSQPVVSKTNIMPMIPPTYFAAQLQAAQRRAQEGIQAVPSLESDGTVSQQHQDSLFSECVLDLSKYLTSDLPTTPREFFDDIFHEKVARDAEMLHKPLPGVIKIKEEPDSAATSRCSTPESLLPEHDFDNADFPTPQFQGSDGAANKGESLMHQLQSAHQSNQSSDVESDGELNMEKLDMNAQKLKAALAELESQESDSPQKGNVSPNEKSSNKSPRHHKSRKSLEKGSEEYLVKRERNNVAVRKSRTKAKLKHIETQMRVGELTEENDQLRNRISELQKELNALKSYISYNNPGIKPAHFSSYPQIFSNSKIVNNM
ncbi:CCAAT/enhancer-binding protein epsilon-like isoform X1 [Clytia hemisphaerica]|uniref:BZIP domain-containing protein n=2 Tax=Clytia hemisphaerica TaxID=252671 RepID=A0A7M5WUB8_9CNID